MRTKIVYLSSDDEEHQTPEACEKHEFQLKLEDGSFYFDSWKKEKLVNWLFEHYTLTPKIPEVTLENLP